MLLQCKLRCHYRVTAYPSGDLLYAIRDGLEPRSELNLDLKFRHVEADRSNTSIEFGENGASNMAWTDCIYTFATEQVMQRCSGELESPSQGAKIMLNRHISNYNILQDTVAHEFGHNLGLCHHYFSDNVMGRGASDNIQFFCDGLCYSIPETLDNDGQTTNTIVGISLLAVMLIATIVWQRTHLTRPIYSTDNSNSGILSATPPHGTICRALHLFLFQV